MIEVDEKGVMVEKEDTDKFEQLNNRYELKIHFAMEPVPKHEVDFCLFQLDDEPLPAMLEIVRSTIENLLRLDYAQRIGISLNEMSSICDSSRQVLLDLYNKWFAQGDNDGRCTV